MLTEKIKLATGIKYGTDAERKPVFYRDVVIRSPFVKDSLEVETECDGKGALTVALALRAKQIVSISRTIDGTVKSIPREEITVDLLAGLSDVDFERIAESVEWLKKKEIWQNAD